MTSLNAVHILLLPRANSCVLSMYLGSAIEDKHTDIKVEKFCSACDRELAFIGRCCASHSMANKAHMSMLNVDKKDEAPLVCHCAQIQLHCFCRM